MNSKTILVQKKLEIKLDFKFDPTFDFFKKLVMKSLAEKLKQTFPKNVKHFLRLPKKRFT